MDPVTDVEIEKAVFTWLGRYYPHTEIDRRMKPFINAESLSGGLRQVRKALFLSLDHMAQKVGISQVSYRQLELAEGAGRISLNNLRRCAEALDCELVYGLRPKERKPISARIWQPLMGEVLRRRHPAHQDIKWSALAVRMQLLMYDTNFRRKQGWVGNRTPSVRLPGARRTD